MAAPHIIIAALLVAAVAHSNPVGPAASTGTIASFSADTDTNRESSPGFESILSLKKRVTMATAPSPRQVGDISDIRDKIKRVNDALKDPKESGSQESSELKSGLRDDAAVARLMHVPYTPLEWPMQYTPHALGYSGLRLILAPVAFMGGLSSDNHLNSLQPGSTSTLRDTPTVPFQVPWPLAPFFPVLVKDPLLTFLHGGGWNDIIEYGQAADVCGNRGIRVADSASRIHEETVIPARRSSSLRGPAHSSRWSRTLSRRAASTVTPLRNALSSKTLKKAKKFNKIKNIKRKPVNQDEEEDEKMQSVTNNGATDGDLRFPFGDFDWFGNKKPVAPSPGFFINRLKVHRGGVAIAGPGGVATAGRGGTAVVGPGGLAYMKPGGLAVAGPHARIMALDADADLDALVERVRARLEAGDKSGAADPEAELVATGPAVYYHDDQAPAA